MDVNEIFNNLRYHYENEVVEFKKAENNFDFDDLGKYFSALSNEANLRGREFAWLVFGVEDKTRDDVQERDEEPAEVEAGLVAAYDRPQHLQGYLRSES
ncbi:MAG: hypothetical protein IJV27_12225 [Prevotella sp.]|nr:hypothetical protein [Prevotella sp.]